VRAVEIVAADLELVLLAGELARERGCHGMSVGVEPGNDAAFATYRAAGAGEPAPAFVPEWRLLALRT